MAAKLAATRDAHRVLLPSERRGAWRLRPHWRLRHSWARLPLCPCLRMKGLALGERTPARLTLLDRATHGRSRAGAAV
jgi:hypothetical protein